MVFTDYLLFVFRDPFTSTYSPVYLQVDSQCLHSWDLLFSTMLLGRVLLTTSSSIWLTHGITQLFRLCKDCKSRPWSNCMYVVWCNLLMPNHNRDMTIDYVISVGSFWVFLFTILLILAFVSNVKSGSLLYNFWFYPHNVSTYQMQWERLFASSLDGQNYCSNSKTDLWRESV